MPLGRDEAVKNIEEFWLPLLSGDPKVTGIVIVDDTTRIILQDDMKSFAALLKEDT